MRTRTWKKIKNLGFLSSLLRLQPESRGEVRENEGEPGCLGGAARLTFVLSLDVVFKGLTLRGSWKRRSVSTGVQPSVTRSCYSEGDRWQRCSAWKTFAGVCLP